MVASKVVVTAAQCCERIQDKHKALVSAGSLKPLSQEAHVRDVLKVGFASRFLQTIRYFLFWRFDKHIALSEMKLPLVDSLIQ